MTYGVMLAKNREGLCREIQKAMKLSAMALVEMINLAYGKAYKHLTEVPLLVLEQWWEEQG
jgi:hypothetical protein